MCSYNASDSSPQGLQDLNTSAPPPPPLPLLTDVKNLTAASPFVLDVRTDPGAIKPLVSAALPATTHDPIVLYLGAMVSCPRSAALFVQIAAWGSPLRGLWLAGALGGKRAEFVAQYFK